MSVIKGFVFDAFGTLLDISSIDQKLVWEFGNKGIELGTTWRSKQLEYSWLCQIMERYQPFSHITRAALQYALNKCAIEVDDRKVTDLANIYGQLPAFEDVAPTLQFLAQRYQLAVLSNGDSRMLQEALSFNKLHDQFDFVLSADEVEQFKPSPKIYELAVEKLEVTKEEIAFVSSNAWDATGAKNFGFRVFWINRKHLPFEQLGVEPDLVLGQLQDLTTNEDIAPF